MEGCIHFQKFLIHFGLSVRSHLGLIFNDLLLQLTVVTPDHLEISVSKYPCFIVQFRILEAFRKPSYLVKSAGKTNDVIAVA